jgi:hypothetical protein
MQFKYDDLVKFQQYVNSEEIDGQFIDNYRTLVGTIDQVSDNFYYVKVDDWFGKHLTLQYHQYVSVATQDDLDKFNEDCRTLRDKNFK